MEAHRRLRGAGPDHGRQRRAGALRPARRQVHPPQPRAGVSGAPDPAYWAGRRVVVTGGAGFLGKPTVRMLTELGAEVRVPRSAEHDLRDPVACRAALDRAETVIHLAANVGGIGYNLRHPAPLAYDNTLIGLNVFEAARQAGIEKLVAVCSVCAYPKLNPIPFRE